MTVTNLPNRDDEPKTSVEAALDRVTLAGESGRWGRRAGDGPSSSGSTTIRHGRRASDLEVEVVADPTTGATAELARDIADMIPSPFDPQARPGISELISGAGAKPAPRVSLVVPAVNEGPNIPWVFERIPDLINEIILVDGYSNDDTVEAALRARPDTRVVLQRARGKGSALRTGFAAATGDYIVMMDADGSMDPGEIELFVTALDHGYDFVKGSRHLPGGGSDDLTVLRNLGNYALKKSVNMMFFVPFTDLCYGYAAFRASCLPSLALTSHGFEIETEMAIRAVKNNLKIAEVPSHESSRRHGLSNLNALRDGQRVLRTLVRERVARRPRPVVDWIQVPRSEVKVITSMEADIATVGVTVTTTDDRHSSVTILTTDHVTDPDLTLPEGDSGEVRAG
jgi:glycosyl transferase family 2